MSDNYQLYTVPIPQVFNIPGGHPQLRNVLITPTEDGLFGFGSDKVPIFLTLGSGVTIDDGVLNVSGGGGSGNVNAAGTLTNNTLIIGQGSKDVASITTGTGILTALGVNIGSAGAPILFNGAGGTPSSMVGTNITGTAAGLTAGAATNGMTAASAAAGAGLLWVSGGADKTAVATDTVATINATTVNAGSISMNSALATDDTYSGLTIIGRNAGATIAQWETVYLGASSTWLLADANGSDTYPACGMAVAAYSSTNPATILVQGTVRNDAWSWTPGGRLYLSGTPGGLTQTPPATSGDKVQDVGYAVTADIAYVDFNGTYVTVA